MSTQRSELFADERGIWERNELGLTPHGIEWGEVYEVHGYLIDAIERTLIYVELRYSWGEFFEFNNEWLGFEQVIQAITDTFPDIAPTWFQTIQELPLGESVTVWQRA